MLRPSVLICIALLICLLPAESRTYIVDDNGFANYKTIGAAVVAASNGDTIYLKPGTYSESFTLNKSLKLMPLMGESGDIVLKGDGKNTGMTITADGCSVEGLIVENFSKAGIEIQSSGNAIMNNKFEKDNPAILILSSNRNLINNNIMKDCSGGVALKYGSNENTVTKNSIDGGILSIYLEQVGNNSVSDNEIADASMGIWLTNSTSAEIAGNKVEGKSFGIWVTNSSASNLTDNMVNGSKWGVYLLNASRVQVYGSSIKDAELGLTLENSSENVIKGCSINNSTVAINLGMSFRNIVSENSLFDVKDVSIGIISSNDNTIAYNRISKGEKGIVIMDSSTNRLENNLLKEINWGLYVDSTRREGFNNYIPESNEVNGKPIAYFYGKSGGLIEEKNLAHLTLAYCDNFTVEKSAITNDALFLFSSNNNRILENNISRCYGMRLLDSRSNDISGNRLSGNMYSGIYLVGSESNKISDNTASDNKQMGISLANCGNNLIRGNIVDHNGDTGVWLDYCDKNIIRDNTVDHNNKMGILLNLSSDNQLFGNNISNNPLGIQLTYAMNNSIYRNNFIGNKDQAEDKEGDNRWDAGNITGGNYWSDHVAKGNPSTGWPRVIPGGKKDSYPFQDMNGWLSSKQAASTPSKLTAAKAKRIVQNISQLRRNLVK